MKVKVTKIVLSLLLVLLLGGFSLSLASAPGGGASHADERTVDDYKAEPAAVADEAHQTTGVQEEHVAEAAHGAEAGSGSKAFTREKLMDFFYRVINFIALVVILVYFLAKPIGNALAGRQQQVIDELETLQEKRDTAERSYKDFESKLAGMEKEMEVVVQRAIAQAENEKAKILEDAENAAEDIKRQAEAAVQAEIVDAKRQLRDEIADQAAALAEELIVKNLTPEDQVKITEQYLDRVGTV